MSVGRHPDINGNLTLTLPGWNSGGTSFTDPQRHLYYGGSFSPEGAPPVGNTEPDAGDFTTLISLPSPGMDVELAFFYHSHSTHNSRFGFRRICNLHIRALSSGTRVPGGPNAGAPSQVTMLRGNDARASYSYDEQSGSFKGDGDAHNQLHFDAANGLWLEELPDGRVMAFAANLSGQEAPILWAQDARGNRHTFDYNSQGFLTALHDAVGRTVTFRYDPNSLLQSVSDWAGRTISFQYDTQRLPGQPLLTRVVGANGATEVEYDYDASGRVIAVRDAEGFQTSYTLDGTRVVQRSVQVQSVWKPSSVTPPPFVTRYSYTGDHLSGQTIITDALGQRLTFDISNDTVTRIADAAGTRFTRSFDNAGRETSRTDALGATFQSPRNAQGAPTSVVDRAGRTTTLERDSWNNLTKLTAPDGTVEQMSYTATDDPTGQKRLLRSRTDALGNITSYSYDARGLLLSVTDPLGHQTSWNYDALGRQIGTTDALGNTSSEAYDAAGNVFSTTDAEGQVSSATYDLGNRVKTTTNALGNVTTFGYDGLGHLVQVTDALGGMRSYSYNVFGLVERAIDELGQVTSTQYDSLGRAVATVDALGRRTSRSYDTRGRLLSTTVAAGELDLTTTIERDGTGQVVATTDPSGARTSYTLSASGQILSQTDTLGAVTSFTYDSLGRLVSQTDALGHVQTTSYDALGHVTALQDARGNTTTMVYDAAGRLTSQTDALGHVTSYEYDALGRQTAVVDALGQRSTTEYDKRSLVVASVDALGHRTETTYDALGRELQRYDASHQLVAVREYDVLGRVTRTADAKGNSQSYVYDARGVLLSVTDPLGGVTNYEHDALGRQSAMIDELGHRTETQYDAAGRVVKTIGAAGELNAEAVTVYNAAGRAIEERDALGHATHYEYDAVVRPTATVGPNGQRSTTEYDVAGRVVAMVDALGHRTEFVLDANRNQMQETDALGHVTSFEYDALDRQVATIDASGVRRETVYDAVGQVVGVRDGRGYETQMSYDAAGRRTAVVDAKGHATTYLYNERDELIEERDPLGRSTFFFYDVAGQHEREIDAEGQETQWIYDALGRVVLKHFADGSEISYVYNAVGNLTRMTDSLGVTDYSYDALNRDLGVLYGSGHQLTYQHDVAGRRIQMTDPDGGVTLYQYDNSDRLTQLTNPQGEVTQFSYDALNRVTQKTLANGVVETHSFDAVGRETLIEQRTASGVLLSSFASAYDRVGQRTSMTEADGSVTSYTYDADGQLLSESRTGTHLYALTYSYDEVGNRILKLQDTLETTCGYDEANQLLGEETRDANGAVVSQGTTSYDANGNVTQQTEDGQTTSYTWNAQDFLVQMTAPDGTSESYAYCGEGIRRTVTNDAGLRRFIRDGKNILLEADGNGDTIRRYTHKGDVWGGLISLHESSTSHFYGFDGSSNTRLLTNESGSVSDAYLYLAFGEELQVTGSSANPLRFGGKVGYYQDDAKRVYVRARHLDVGAGRWISRDPIGFEGGDFNLYRYVGNNPCNHLDPTGQQFFQNLKNSAIENSPQMRTIKSNIDWLNSNKSSKCNITKLSKIYEVMEKMIGGAFTMGRKVSGGAMQKWLLGKGNATIGFGDLTKDSIFSATVNEIEKNVNFRVCKEMKSKPQSSFCTQNYSKGFVQGSDFHYAFHNWDGLSAKVTYKKVSNNCRCTNGGSGKLATVTKIFKFNDRYDWSPGEFTPLPHSGGRKFNQQWALDLLQCKSKLLDSIPKDFTTRSSSAKKVVDVCCCGFG